MPAFAVFLPACRPMVYRAAVQVLQTAFTGPIATGLAPGRNRRWRVDGCLRRRRRQAYARRRNLRRHGGWAGQFHGVALSVTFARHLQSWLRQKSHGAGARRVLAFKLWACPRERRKTADLRKQVCATRLSRDPVAVGIQDSGFKIQDREACSSGKTKSRRLKKTSLRYPASRPRSRSEFRIPDSTFQGPRSQEARLWGGRNFRIPDSRFKDPEAQLWDRGQITTNATKFTFRGRREAKSRRLKKTSLRYPADDQSRKVHSAMLAGTVDSSPSEITKTLRRYAANLRSTGLSAGSRTTNTP